MNKKARIIAVCAILGLLALVAIFVNRGGGGAADSEAVQKALDMSKQMAPEGSEVPKNAQGVPIDATFTPETKPGKARPSK